MKTRLKKGITALLIFSSISMMMPVSLSAADKTAPALRSSTPRNLQTNVKRNAMVRLTFSEYVYKSSNFSKIKIVQSSTGKAISIKYRSVYKNYLNVYHKYFFKYNSYYVVTVPAYSVKDKAGNILKKTITFKFKTLPKPVVTPTATPTATPVNSITVSAQGNATTLDNGKTLQMSATVAPTTAADKTIVWSVVPGTGSASIDSATGLLTATAVGTVTVVATNAASGVTGSIVITIAVAPVVIESKVSGLGMPTSMVRVKDNGVLVNAFSVYFDGKLLESTTDGDVTVASGVLSDLTRVQIQIAGVLRSIESNNQWT